MAKLKIKKDLEPGQWYQFTAHDPDFKPERHVYILGVVESTEEGVEKYCLINTWDGNRWKDAGPLSEVFNGDEQCFTLIGSRHTHSIFPSWEKI